MENETVLLPEMITYKGWIYQLSDELLERGDWYTDHQKYNWNYGNPIEYCDKESLANFINGGGDGKWHSKKIVKTTDPKLITAGVESLFENY